MCLDKGILNDIQRVVMIAHHTQSHGVSPPLITSDKLSKSLTLSRLCLAHPRHSRGSEAVAPRLQRGGAPKQPGLRTQLLRNKPILRRPLVQLSILARQFLTQ